MTLSLIPVVSSGWRRRGVTSARAVALMLLCPVVSAIVSAIAPVVSAVIVGLLVAACCRPSPPTVHVLLVRQLLRLRGSIPAMTPAASVLLLPWILGLVVGGRRSQQTVLPGMLERLVTAAVWRTVVSLLVAAWWRGVAVLSAMLVSVQTVTQSPKAGLVQVNLLPVWVEAQLGFPRFPVPLLPISWL